MTETNNAQNEYDELESMRREAAEGVDLTEPKSLFGRFFRWALSEIEDQQKEIINKRFGR